MRLSTLSINLIIFCNIIYLILCYDRNNDNYNKSTKYCNDSIINYTNPHLLNESSYNVSVSVKNRCLIYPRCKLFQCCHESHVNYVNHYIKSQECHDYPNYKCQNKRNHLCNRLRNAPLSERLSNLNITNLTITNEYVHRGLANLPPTPPTIFNLLKHNNKFRVLYLSQGYDKKQLTALINSSIYGDGLLFLNFKEKSLGDLYYPNSDFAMGRLALYLAVRLLEMYQGWLYHYFIFMDDDALFIDPLNSLPLFENMLIQWLPALGSPSYEQYPEREIDTSGHSDFIVLAYHREAVEYTHPWILDFDKDCLWASELIQILEGGLLYRNHQIVTKEIKVINSKHRDYPKDCIGPGLAFDILIKGQYQAMPYQLKNCTLSDLSQLGDFHQGVRTGKPRIKVENYYRIEDFFTSYNSSSHIDCQSHLLDNKENPNCCSLDQAYVNSNEPLHNKILIYDHLNISVYIWGNRKHLLHNKKIKDLMGVSINDVIHVNTTRLYNAP